MKKQTRRKFAAAFKAKVALEAVKNQHLAPAFGNTLLPVRASFFIVVCWSNVISLCSGLVALLHFLPGLVRQEKCKCATKCNADLFVSSVKTYISQPSSIHPISTFRYHPEQKD